MHKLSIFLQVVYESQYGGGCGFGPRGLSGFNDQFAPGCSRLRWHKGVNLLLHFKFTRIEKLPPHIEMSSRLSFKVVCGLLSIKFEVFVMMELALDF